MNSIQQEGGMMVGIRVVVAMGFHSRMVSMRDNAATGSVSRDASTFGGHRSDRNIHDAELCCSPFTVFGAV